MRNCVASQRSAWRPIPHLIPRASFRTTGLLQVPTEAPLSGLASPTCCLANSYIAYQAAPALSPGSPLRPHLPLGGLHTLPEHPHLFLTQPRAGCICVYLLRPLRLSVSRKKPTGLCTTESRNTVSSKPISGEGMNDSRHQTTSGFPIEVCGLRVS